MDWNCQTNMSLSWAQSINYSYTLRSYEAHLSLTLHLNMELPIQRSCLAFNHSCLSPWQSQSCSTPTEWKPYGMQLDSCSGLSYSCTLHLLPMIHPINCHVNRRKCQMRFFSWTFGHLAKKVIICIQLLWRLCWYQDIDSPKFFMWNTSLRWLNL